tara:strand:- start:365 stop:751 length:387 start_codon:yes stop_codon:yes gene_type:complete
MYLLNKNNDESIFKNFDGEQTLVSGNQGGYEYIKVIKGDAQLNENPVEDDYYYDETILQYRVFYRPSRDQQDNLESWSQDFDKLWSLYASSSSLEGANAIIERKGSVLYDYKVVDSGIKKEVIKRLDW